MEKNLLAVTGITGKSGLYFLKEILKNEEVIHKKWAGICFSSRELSKVEWILNRTQNSEIDFKPFIGNIIHEDFCKELCSNCNTLLHIAGIHSSRIIVKAAIDVGVKRMILVHTTGIYSKYKAAGEVYRQTDEMIYKLCQENHITLTILRPTMIYGNLSDGNVAVFIHMVDKFPIVPTVNGAHYELQPVHCKDLGKAYYNVLINEKTYGNDYILSGGTAIELRKMFDVIAENLGVKRNYFSCPFPIAYVGAWGIYVLTFGKKDYREKVQRLVESRVYDHKNATEDFGYDPVPFEVGVVREVKEYIKQKK